MCTGCKIENRQGVCVCVHSLLVRVLAPPRCTVSVGCVMCSAAGRGSVWACRSQVLAMPSLSPEDFLYCCSCFAANYKHIYTPFKSTWFAICIYLSIMWHFLIKQNIELRNVVQDFYPFGIDWIEKRIECSQN